MRFDVYKIPAGGVAGLIVDVQADLLSDLPTRMVIPLIADPKLDTAFKGLNPQFEINGHHYILMTQQLGSIHQRHVQRPVASLAVHRDDITRALDLLLTGF